MKALFLGEGDLAGPARYLAAVLRWSGIRFDHRPDQSRLPKAWQKSHRYRVVICSDYRYSAWTPAARRWLIREVTETGAGFLMIGGWASFTGLVGGYAGSDIERDLLPVRCYAGDDRVHCPSGSLVSRAEWRVRSAELGLEECSSASSSKTEFPAVHSALRTRHSALPMVCGYHRAHLKPGASTVLQLRDLSFAKGRPRLGPAHPLLVLGRAGRGRTAAFLTDCAPHWAGGLVDWGRRRATVRVAAGVGVELGETYLRFFASLIRSLLRR